MKAKELEEAEKKKEQLELALKAAKDEMAVAVKNAKAEVGCLALVACKKLEEYVGLLGERYGGGWPRRGASTIPIRLLTRSRWRLLLLRVLICVLSLMSLTSVLRRLSPTFYPLLKMKKRLPLEDF